MTMPFSTIKPERSLWSLDPDKFAQAAAAQEEAERRREWPLLHGDGQAADYLFADQANQLLEDMRREYAYLLAKYRVCLDKCDTLEAALNRALEVLAAQEKTHEM